MKKFLLFSLIFILSGCEVDYIRGVVTEIKLDGNSNILVIKDIDTNQIVERWTGTTSAEIGDTVYMRTEGNAETFYSKSEWERLPSTLSGIEPEPKKPIEWPSFEDAIGMIFKVASLIILGLLSIAGIIISGKLVIFSIEKRFFNGRY